MGLEHKSTNLNQAEDEEKKREKKMKNEQNNFK